MSPSARDEKLAAAAVEGTRFEEESVKRLPVEFVLLWLSRGGASQIANESDERAGLTFFCEGLLDRI